MKRYIFSLMALWTLLLTSCYRDFQYESDDFFPHIVLHSFVQADSAIRVNVSKSWMIGEEPGDFSPEEARVSLYINDEPRELETAIPRSGDHLRMVVEANGLQTAEATTVVPEKIEIKQVDYTFERNNIYSSQYTFQLKIHIQDPPGERNYYGIGVGSSDSLVSSIDVDMLNEPLFLGLASGNILDDLLFRPKRLLMETYPLSDEGIDGMEYVLTISVYVGVQGDKEGTDYSYTVCLYSLSESYYKYLLSLVQQDVNRLSEYGVADMNLTYRNVKNGLGVLAAFQVDTVEIHWTAVKP